MVIASGLHILEYGDSVARKFLVLEFICWKL